MIDAGIQHPWPPEIGEATAKFKQGHLVERPPFFYAARPEWGIWDYTKENGDPHAADDLLELTDEDRPRYGLITTQGCDLAEQRPLPRKPWIQICPVYDASNLIAANQRGQLHSGLIQHLVELTSNSLPPGLWVADLRIEFPVEKSWLVGRNPVEAFDEESAYLELAERLAGLRERPDMADELIEIAATIDEWIQGLNAQQHEAAFSGVLKVHMIVGGDRLHPETAQLLIISDVAASEGAQNLWDGWWQGARQAAKGKGITLIGNRYETLATLSAADYLRSAPLNFLSN